MDGSEPKPALCSLLRGDETPEASQLLQQLPRQVEGCGAMARAENQPALLIPGEEGMAANKTLDAGMARIHQQVVMAPATALHVETGMPTKLELKDPIIDKRWSTPEGQKATAEFTSTLRREPDPGHLNAATKPCWIPMQPAWSAKLIRITTTHGRPSRDALRIETDPQKLSALLGDGMPDLLAGHHIAFIAVGATHGWTMKEIMELFTPARIRTVFGSKSSG